MPKSDYAHAVDQIQTAMKGELRGAGFRVRGRTFNRLTDDGLTQVINFQMGPSDPPGATHIPGLTDNLHGLFAINLGVYVPEVAQVMSNVAKGWVQDHNCCVRSRLGALVAGGKDIWWAATSDITVVADLRRCIAEAGIPFLDSYGSRDQILSEWRGRSAHMGISDPPRIVMAVILLARGRHDEAHQLLVEQARDAHASPHRGIRAHADYVRELAGRLGLGDLGV